MMALSQGDGLCKKIETKLSASTALMSISEQKDLFVIERFLSSMVLIKQCFKTTQKALLLYEENVACNNADF